MSDIINGNGENRIRKAVESDLGKAVKLVAFTFGIAMAWASLFYKVDNIQNNHLPHIQAKLDQACAVNERQDESIKQIDLKIERILTIIDK